MALHTSLRKRAFAAAFQIRAYSAPADRSIPASKQKYVPTFGDYPKGFLAGSAHAGVKASNTKHDDIALVVSETPCAATGVFTRNIFKAAPVRVSQGMLRERKSHGFRGVVVNSGCANAVTGTTGMTDAYRMAKTADECFKLEVSEEAITPNTPSTLVMSTGVIGQKLPMDRITEAIPKAHAALGSTHDHWMSAAQAICTTDTFPKLLSRTFTLPTHPATIYTIAGMTKGAGMIHPNMGTLLGIICTDVKITPGSMKPLLKKACAPSFNQISIDGDTSTNDTVVLLANGAAAPTDAQPLRISKPRSRGEEIFHVVESEDTVKFSKVLTEFMKDLAKLVVRDGEGATKFVTIKVISDISLVIARRVATSIATSSLVKTALYGKDANWGRILCAIGYTPGIMPDPSTGIFREEGNRGLPIQTARTSMCFTPADGSAPLYLLYKGEPQEVDEARAKEILEMEDLQISVRLEDDGPEIGRFESERYTAEFWTCDFSHEYVTINGDYRT